MGIFKWLFGKPTPRATEARHAILTTLPEPPPSNRDYPYEVVGESFYQRELSHICGEKPRTAIISSTEQSFGPSRKIHTTRMP